MRRVMRRAGAVAAWGLLLAGWVSVVSPAWSQAPAAAPGAASRDPAFDSHLPWIFRERALIVLEAAAVRSAVGGRCGVAGAASVSLRAIRRRDLCSRASRGEFHFGGLPSTAFCFFDVPEGGGGELAFVAGNLGWVGPWRFVSAAVLLELSKRPSES